MRIAAQDLLDTMRAGRVFPNFSTGAKAMKNKILASLIAAFALLSINTAAQAGTIICFPSGACVDIGDIGIFP
jgi:hypothetical protein